MSSSAGNQVTMGLKSFTLFVTLAFAAAPAAADTTAVYASKSKVFPTTMTVEIGNDGSIRYQTSMGRTYGLVLNGVDYFVDLSGRTPVVNRASDLVAVQREAMAAHMRAFQRDEPMNESKLIPIGKVTINGREGRGFGYESDSKLAADRPAVVVVSDDPDLAQLGKAMGKQFATSVTMLSRMIGSTPGKFTQMQEILASGAPLSFAGMELQSVNHAPIDPDRFKLPAEPETLDQIRERMKPLPPPPTAPLAKP